MKFFSKPLLNHKNCGNEYWNWMYPNRSGSSGILICVISLEIIPEFMIYSACITDD